MPQLTRQVETPYTPHQMFDLVSDVKAYPAFIPWIRKMSVTDETTSETAWTGRARAAVGFKGFSESFTTDVSAFRDENLVAVTLVRGPFRKLENRWRFFETDGGCRIEFFIDFDFSNPLLQMLFNANMDRAIKALMSAFLAEAHRRYGGASA